MSDERQKLFEVARIENGWLVTICDDWGHSKREVFCASWEDVAATTRREAFPFPNPNEPRGPRHWAAKFDASECRVGGPADKEPTK